MTVILLVFLNSAAYSLSIKSHIWITEQAIRIIEEKYPEYKETLEQYRSQLIQGVIDCDLKQVHVPPTPSTSHFYDPWSHAGITNPSAGSTCQLLIAKALKLFQDGNIQGCWSEFARALHLVEDIGGVPFHASSLQMIGKDMKKFHDKYEEQATNVTKGESVVSEILDTTLVRGFSQGGKNHCNLNTAEGWVDLAAHKSNGYFARVKRGDTNQYQAVLEKLIPFDQKISAAFLLWFLQKLDIPNLSIDANPQPIEENPTQIQSKTKHSSSVSIGGTEIDLKKTPVLDLRESRSNPLSFLLTMMITITFFGYDESKSHWSDYNRYRFNESTRKWELIGSDSRRDLFHYSSYPTQKNFSIQYQYQLNNTARAGWHRVDFYFDGELIERFEFQIIK